MDQQYKQMVDFYNQINKYAQDNGMLLEAKTPGHIFYEMEVMEKHASSPNTCHGAVIAGLMDAVLGTAALSLAFTKASLVSTVEFKLNFFKPAMVGETLIGEGKIEFEGKSLISASGEIRNKDTNQLVSKGIGTFNIYPVEKRNFWGEI